MPGPTAVTLHSLTLGPTTVTGGDTSTGTVTLTGPAPTGGLSVALSSNSATATVPDTVTVLAGETTAPFAIATTPTAETTVATITATHGTVTKTADLTVEAPPPPPPAEAVALQSLSLNQASIVGGRSALGRVTLTGLAPAGGIEVALSSDASSAGVPASVTVLEGQSSATFPISTTAVSASATATITAAYEGVVKTAQLRVTPRFEITNISNGDVLSGYVQVDVAVYDSTVSNMESILKVNGVFYDRCKPMLENSGSNLRRALVATQQFSNGNSVLSVSDSTGNSDNRTVTFQNDVSQLNYAAIFDVSPGVTDVPPACQITATVESGSGWTVTIKDDSNNPIKTFTGSGTSISVTWDGTSDAGAMQPEGNYQLFFSTATTGLMSTKSKTRGRRKMVLGRPTKPRGGIRLHAAPDGGSSSSFDYPLGITNKHKFSDSLVILDVGVFVGGVPTAINYAKFIRAQVSAKIFQTFGYPCYPLLINTGVMQAGTPTARAISARINEEFKRPKKLIYVFSHGGLARVGLFGTVPFFALGSYYWGSNNSADTNNVDDFNVRTLVAPLGYGEDMDPPKLVWLDNCQSGGGAFGNSSNPSMGDGVDTQWAECFGIDPANGLEGVFLGISGDGYFYAEGDSWAVWKREMWSLLMSEGRNFQTSFDLAKSRTPMNYSNFRNPQDRYRWYGTGSTAF